MDNIIDFSKKREEKDNLKQTCQLLDGFVTIIDANGKKITVEEFVKLSK